MVPLFAENIGQLSTVGAHGDQKSQYEVVLGSLSTLQNQYKLCRIQFWSNQVEVPFFICPG